MPFEAVPRLRVEADSESSEIAAEVGRWVNSDPILELAEAFGAGDRQGDLDSTLESLDTFSADHWDFRRGRERNLALQEEFPPETGELVASAARALGMTDPEPPRFDRYDHVLVLGGLVRACVLRPQYAAALIGSGLACTDVTALGAFRPLGGDEPDLATAGGLVGVENEVEAMDAGMRRAFDLGDPESEEGRHDAESPTLSWLVRRYVADTGRGVSVIAAPTTDPTRRANTPDTYKYWAEKVVELVPGDKVLLVTSAIYVPFQHADAIRMLTLPYGAEVDTVGLDTTQVADSRLRQTFTPANYLQEVRSAIRSMKALFEAARLD